MQYSKEGKFQRCTQFTWSTEEELADEWFSGLKLSEEEHIRSDFFEKDTIKHLKLMKSLKSYQLLDRMPKGVLHHVHAACMDDIEFIKKYVVNYPNTYINKDLTSWHYGTQAEACTNGWMTPAHARTLFLDDESFDRAITLMTEFLPEEADKYSHCENVWDMFEEKIRAFLPIYYQEDLYRDYLYHISELHIRNGFYRLELKVILFGMKRRNPAEKLSPQQVVELTEQVEQDIQSRHPFFSIGLIPFGLKLMSDRELEDYIRLTYEIDSHLIVGLDMANEEDKYPDFDRCRRIISKVEKQFEHKKKLPGVYHAGETRSIRNHNVSKVTEFGSVRIGHGLNLFQHAYLIPTILARGICIEVCPLSNQFLGYVYNLSQHPAIAFYNLGIPITISSDDPGKFGYSGVTPDYFVAAHAFGFSLKDMKLIGLYSIGHALCSQQVKEALYTVFNEQWNSFIASLPLTKNI